MYPEELTALTSLIITFVYISYDIIQKYRAKKQDEKQKRKLARKVLEFEFLDNESKLERLFKGDYAEINFFSVKIWEYLTTSGFVNYLEKTEGYFKLYQLLNEFNYYIDYEIRLYQADIFRVNQLDYSNISKIFLDYDSKAKLEEIKAKLKDLKKLLID